jgi:hypothetical protein
MDLSAYPNLSFKLDSGRTVRVHAFIWEASYPETLEVATAEGKKQLEIERNRFRCSDIISPTKTHIVNWELVDEFVNHPPRVPNCVINVLLSSEPMSEEALYSELAVLLFTDHFDGWSIESVLTRHLHDLDWERLAVNVRASGSSNGRNAYYERKMH